MSLKDANVETVWFHDFVKDLPKASADQVFVISGTTSGTGFVAAQTAAQLGGTVVLLNRKSERATKSLEQLKTALGPDAKLVPIECDLQSFASVRAAIAEIKKRYKSLYALCWNAGIMATPDKATVDGYDTQMQTNHFSHFLLTAELYPLLEEYSKTHPDSHPRIVNHSSGGRHMTPNGALERKYFEKNGGNLGGDQVGTGGSPFSGAPYLRYFQTKLANAVFTKALHNKLTGKSSAIYAICADPGMSATNLADHLISGEGSSMDVSKMAAMMQTSQDGAMGIIRGMLDPNVESGVHYGPAKTKGPAVINEERPYETNAESIAMLWETSEAATGVKFAI